MPSADAFDGSEGSEGGSSLVSMVADLSGRGLGMEAFEPLHTSRLQEFDYGQTGLYFVTICTQDRHPWFGDVHQSGMRKSTIGEAAETAWLAIPGHFPDVRVDEFCVMPDHVHGLLEIVGPSVPNVGTPVGTQNFASLRMASLRRDSHRAMDGNQFGPQSRNLAAIVRGYKIGVTKIARDIDPSFRWQARYWDRVVRDPCERNRIRAYIRENAETWWITHNP